MKKKLVLVVGVLFKRPSGVALLVVLAICILAAVLFYSHFYRFTDQNLTEGAQAIPPNDFISHPMFLKAFLERFLHSHGYNHVTAEILQNIRFDSPETDEYKQNPEWQVLPSLTKRANPVSRYKESIGLVSSSENFSITLSNNIDGVGTDSPDLLAVLPNIKKDICISINRIYTSNVESSKIPLASSQPLLIPYDQPSDRNASIYISPSEEGVSAGCFEFGGIYYYYYVLYVL